MAGISLRPLPRGITEGWPGDHSIKDFKALCYEMARMIRDSQVLDMPEEDLHKNFLRARMIISGRPLYILCNIAFPLIATAGRDPFREMQDFVNCQEIADLLKDRHDWEYLSASFLEHPIDQSDFSQLGDKEIEDIRYWEPLNFGDAIFNWWD